MFMWVPYWYPKLLEGADGVSGQMSGATLCPFSGLTNSGRAWMKGAGK